MSLFAMLREPFDAVSHGLGAMVAILGTIYLWNRAGRKPGSRVSCLIYGVCLTFCLASSAALHGAIVPDPVFDVLLKLDHIGIFLLIAGTYTPIAWNLLEGRWRRITLIGIWTLAALGVGLYLIYEHPPIILSTVLYLAMGWGSLLSYNDIAQASPRGAHWWLLAGGILYSLGATFNVLQWPNPLPGIVGYHGQFHLFVLAAAATHFVFVLKTSRPLDSSRQSAIPGADFARPRSQVHAVNTGI